MKKEKHNIKKKDISKSDKKHKVLVIASEIKNAKSIGKILSEGGYIVETTSKPMEVVNILKSADFEVALLDVEFLNSKDFLLIEVVKKIQPKLEVIIMTPQSVVNTAIEFLKKGAIEYVVKPFGANELLASVEKVLQIIELKVQLISLKDLDKSKDEFISTVSHELKTPLTAISGSIEVIFERERAENEKRNEQRRQIDKDMHKLFAIIGRQTKKMKELVANLLDFVKIEAGFMQLKKTKLQMINIVKEVIQEIKPLIDAKKIEIISNIDSDYVNCNGESIKIVILNLITNSIKYTKENGKINVSFTKQCNRFKFVVEDNGIGIEKQNLDRIFDKFYRIDRSLVREAGGFGIGLAICKKIIELHNGKIWAKSSGLGKGSKFIFTLQL